MSPPVQTATRAMTKGSTWPTAAMFPGSGCEAADPPSGSVLPELAVIPDMRPVDMVVALLMEYAELAAGAGVHDRKVIEQVEGTIVEQHMIVRA